MTTAIQAAKARLDGAKTLPEIDAAMRAMAAAGSVRARRMLDDRCPACENRLGSIWKAFGLCHRCKAAVRVRWPMK